MTTALAVSATRDAANISSECNIIHSSSHTSSQIDNQGTLHARTMASHAPKHVKTSACLPDSMHACMYQINKRRDAKTIYDRQDTRGIDKAPVIRVSRGMSGRRHFAKA